MSQYNDSHVKTPNISGMISVEALNNKNITDRLLANQNSQESSSIGDDKSRK
jgi:hypothetical protein